MNFLKSIMILIVIIFMTNSVFSRITEITDELKNEIETLVSLDQDNFQENQLMEEFLKNYGGEILEHHGGNKKHQKHHDTPAANGDPSQEYDFYVFTVSWSDSFCRTQYTPALCYQKLNALNEKRILRIHGLWPSRQDGKYLSDCHTGPDIQIPDIAAEPYITMEQIWPSLNKHGIKNFWTHEYNKHGYCYTHKYDIATYTPYFEKAVEMYNQYDIKTLMGRAFDTTPGKEYTLHYDEIKANFKRALGGDHFEIKCSYNRATKVQYLDEVRLFLDMDFKPLQGFTYNSNCPRSGPIKFFMENDQ